MGKVKRVKVLNIEGLKYYDRLIKQYIDKRIEIGTKGKTSCPNCAAIITSDVCEYCGTNLGKWFSISDESAI